MREGSRGIERVSAGAGRTHDQDSHHHWTDSKGSGHDGFRYGPRNGRGTVVWVVFGDGPVAPEPRARGALSATCVAWDLLDPDFAVGLRATLHTFNATVESPAVNG